MPCTKQHCQYTATTTKVPRSFLGFPESDLDGGGGCSWPPLQVPSLVQLVDIVTLRERSPTANYRNRRVAASSGFPVVVFQMCNKGLQRK
jgi:hypothetical protein